MPCIAKENICAFNRITAQIAVTKAELEDWYALSENESVSVFYKKSEGKNGPKWKSSKKLCTYCHSSGSWFYTKLSIDALELTAKPIQACKDRLEKLEKEIRDLEE